MIWYEIVELLLLLMTVCTWQAADEEATSKLIYIY